MLKDGENLKDNQRNEISISNIKLSERTSKNRCIHRRMDVRAKSVKGELVRSKRVIQTLKKGQLFLKSVVVKQLVQSIERKYRNRF